MKKIIISILFLFCFVNINAQQDSTKKYEISKQDYLAKSKVNKRTGWILLAAGAAMTTGGAIGILNDPNLLEGTGSDGPYVLFVSGVLAMGASVPLFIISANQAHKAATLTVQFSIEKTLAYENGINASAIKAIPHHIIFPAISIRIKTHK